MRLRTLGLAVLIAVGGAVEAHAAARPKDRPEDRDVLAYRRALMITLNEQSAALGMILSGVVTGDAAAHLEVIALTAAYATKDFTPRVEGGESRPEIWTKWADFSKRMDDFARKTAVAAKIALEKGPGSVNVLDALACKACHDLYRDETKR